MNTWIIVGCIVLLVVLLFLSVFWGCTCKEKEEGFENKEDDELPALEPIAGVSDAILTTKEKEMFEDLKNNRLNDKQIHEMVKTGELTENTIEKFLANLSMKLPADTAAASAPTAPAPATPKKEDASVKKNEDKIEGFAGSMSYARIPERELQELIPSSTELKHFLRRSPSSAASGTMPPGPVDARSLEGGAPLACDTR